jgi:uncharacterized Zn finger protein (UPF0148 family)
MKNWQQTTQWNRLSEGETGRDVIAEMKCKKCGAGLLQKDGEDEPISEIHFPNCEAVAKLEETGLLIPDDAVFCEGCMYELEEITRD